MKVNSRSATYVGVGIVVGMGIALCSVFAADHVPGSYSHITRARVSLSEFIAPVHDELTDEIFVKISDIEMQMAAAAVDAEDELAVLKEELKRSRENIEFMVEQQRQIMVFHNRTEHRYEKRQKTKKVNRPVRDCGMDGGRCDRAARASR